MITMGYDAHEETKKTDVAFALQYEDTRCNGPYLSNRYMELLFLLFGLLAWYEVAFEIGLAINEGNWHEKHFDKSN